MSPDRKYFPGLRAAIEQQQERARSERIAEEVRRYTENQRMSRVKTEAERQKELLESRHSLAEGYLDDSGILLLIDELRQLYDQLGRGHLVFLRDSWPYQFHTFPNYGVSYSSPMQIPEENSYIGVSWKEVIEKRFGFKRFQTKQTAVDVRGFFVMADYLGNVSFIGSQTDVLREYEWRGNPDWQADCLNRAFEFPFLVHGERYEYDRTTPER